MVISIWDRVRLRVRIGIFVGVRVGVKMEDLDMKSGHNGFKSDVT